MAKYAVLVSAGRTDVDDSKYHSEYWYDLLDMYRTLIDYGFTHENIFVLYGDGHDYDSIHSEYKTGTYFDAPTVPAGFEITDYPNSKNDVKNIFQWLENGNPAENVPQIQNTDFLLVWWLGHGWMDCGPDAFQFNIFNTSEAIYQNPDMGPGTGCPARTEITDIFNQVSYFRRVFLVNACYSGRLPVYLNNNQTVALVSSDWLKTSESLDFDGILHSLFHYYVTSALRQENTDGTLVQSDTDNNNLVSIEECWTHLDDQGLAQLPERHDDGNIASCIFLKRPLPGKTIEMMSRDHENDDGSTPSSYQTWYHGPDLWVRRIQDGVPTHEEPIYGQTNYIYARVHNIGCSSITGATIEYSWCEQSAWANPANWNLIASEPLPTIPRLGKTEECKEWTNLPLPGTYCLHSVISHPQDMPDLDPKAFMDKNKVQINLTVSSASPEIPAPSPFLIENAAESSQPFDLVIDTSGILRRSGVNLELPVDLKFQGIEGAEIIEESKKIILSIRKNTSIVKGIQLKPKSKEKKRLILEILPPKTAKLGGKSTVRVETRVSSRTMGGIEFISHVADEKKVALELLQRKVGLYRFMWKELKITEAKEVYRQTVGILRQRRASAKDTTKSIAAMMEFEHKVTETNEFKTLKEASKEYYSRYLEALKGKKEGMENLRSILKHEVRVLLYLSLLLTEYIKKIDNI